MAEKKKFEYDDFEYDDFSYDTYQESDLVKQAKAALDTHLATKPGAYQSQWQTQLNDVMNKIMNREPFSYDLNGDALYQQYKDKYIQQGKLAMGDAIGQASTMTGGYGNSYAQSVGQQLFQKELQNLNDKIPELYQMALSKYDMDTQNLYNQQTLLGQMEDRDYGKYRDTVSDWNTEKGYLTDRYDAERNLDYSKYSTDRDFAFNQYSSDRSHDYGVYSDNKNLAYTDYRNAIEDEQWRISHDAQVDAKAAELAYQQERDKVKDAQWEKEFDAVYGVGGKDSSTGGGNNGGGGNNSGGSYDNGSLTTEQIKDLQRALGVEADGYYGSISKEAANGLSAEKAYEEYVGGGYTKKEAPADVDIDADLNHIIASGADKSEIKAYLREALKSGVISNAEYQEYIKKYAPVGYTY